MHIWNIGCMYQILNWEALKINRTKNDLDWRFCFEKLGFVFSFSQKIVIKWNSQRVFCRIFKPRFQVFSKVVLFEINKNQSQKLSLENWNGFPHSHSKFFFSKKLEFNFLLWRTIVVHSILCKITISSEFFSVYETKKNYQDPLPFTDELNKLIIFWVGKKLTI